MTTDDMKCDGVAKLKFSEVRKMLRERRVEMDEPGVWLMADCDGSTATYDADGLEGQLRSILFPMAAQALGELMTAAERQEPEAWGVLATWFARGHRGKCGMDVLSRLLNGAAEVRVMDKAQFEEILAGAKCGKDSEHQEGGEA